MQHKHNSDLVPAAKALRKSMTPEERHLWYDFLRLYPVRFQRQKILGHYVVDFYCAGAKLVVELDGSQHGLPDARAKDSERTAFLEQYGLSVIRIPNRDIHQKFKEVCYYIDSVVKQSLSR